MNQNHSGFVKGGTTEKVILILLDKARKELNEGQHTVAFFFDISKAYDCIDTERMILKLNRYGIRDSPIKWIESFITNRKTAVKIEETIGEDKIQITGLLQGSCLAPILFDLCAKDLFELELHGDLIAYADDIIQIQSEKRENNLKHYINEDLRKIQTGSPVMSYL